MRKGAYHDDQKDDDEREIDDGNHLSELFYVTAYCTVTRGIRVKLFYSNALFLEMCYAMFSWRGAGEQKGAL